MPWAGTGTGLPSRVPTAPASHQLAMAAMEAWSWLVAGAITLVALLAAFKWRSSKKSGQARDLPLPPGPRGLPVLGNLLQLRGSARIEEKILALAREHGPLLWLRFGSIPTLMVTSPDMARHVYKDQDKLFSHRRAATYAISNLLYFGRHFFDPHGPVWKFLVRKRTVLELLTHNQMEKYRPVRDREFANIVHFVRQVSLSSPPAIDLSAAIAGALLNAATQISWGKSYCNPTSDDREHDRASLLKTMEEWKKTADWMVRETGHLMHNTVVIGDLVPALSFLDLLLSGSARKRVHDNFTRMDGFFQGLLDERRSHLAAHKPRLEAEGDILDSMLAGRDDDGNPHSDTTIKGTLQSALFNMTENLFTTVEWALAELLSNPEHLRTVYEELDAVVGRERVVQESDLVDLPFLRAVMKESWRLHTPVFSPPHSNPVETEIAGYRIPAHTSVMINYYGIGRDAAVWADPDCFRPQRFMPHAYEHQDASHIEANGQHMELLIFGAGQRQCLGVKLVPRIQGLLMARLLQSFHLELSPEHPFSLRPAPGTIEHHLHDPLLVIASPRLPPHLYAHAG